MMDVAFEEAPTRRAYQRLRGYQPDWLESIDRDLSSGITRALVVAPGGVGKTTLFAALAERFHARRIKTLVLENRERLTQQTADRLRKETGLDVDVEMSAEHASPFAPIVVASVQTLGRINRLTAFADSHFGLVVPDEAHLSIAPQWQRIIRYFHYGSESLSEDWHPPEDGTYQHKAVVCAFTATPDIGDRRSLQQYYQSVERDGEKQWTVSYSYMEAVRDGWLVRPVQKCIPVKIDLRRYKVGSTTHGTDFKDANVSEAIAPVIEELADQVVAHASDRKTMCFLPSVECARMMTDALQRRQMDALYVSGECADGDEKADYFARAGKGTVLSNAQIFNFGVDFPDVDCIGWFRATLSKAFYIQGIYRGTRVLPGIVDGIDLAEDRRAAIAASAKRDVLILDPLFVSDRIDLCDTYDLFTNNEEVKKRMRDKGAPSEENAQDAERDFLKALNQAARKAARKQARIIDPIQWAVMLGEEKLRAWEPQAAWESTKPTPGQIDFLRRHHIDVSKIPYKGLAQKVIGIVLNRLKLRLATPSQLDFLHKLGMDAAMTATLSQSEATKMIATALEAKRST